MLWENHQPDKAKNIKFSIRKIFYNPNLKFAVYLVIGVFFALQSTYAQCEDKSFYEHKIQKTYHPVTGDIDSQLSTLMDLREVMTLCRLTKDSVYTYLLQKIGTLNYYRGNYDSAIYFTKLSIKIGEEEPLSKKKYTSLLLDNYYNLYFYYNILGEEAKSLEAIDKGLILVLKSNVPNKIGLTVLITKIEHLFNKSEYNLAYQLSKLAEAIVQQYFPEENNANYSLFFINIQANFLFFSQDYSAAKKILKIAVERYEHTTNKNLLGSLYSLFGRINKEEGDYNQALYFYKKAYERNLKINYNQGCAQNLIFIGNLKGMYFGKTKEGIASCKKALLFGDEADSLLAFKELGNLYALEKNFDSAQRFFEFAFNMVRPGMNEINILKDSFMFPGFNQLQDLSDIITGKGNAYLLQFKVTGNNSYLKKALTVYKGNDLFLSKIKTEQHLQFNSNLIWRTTARNLYEKAIEACYAGNNLEDAFYFFEKSRAILLNDQVFEVQRKVASDFGKETQLKKRIVNLEKKINDTKFGTDSFILLQKTLCLATMDLAAFYMDLQKNERKVLEKNQKNPVLTLKNLKKHLLGNSRSLLEIFAGDSAIYVLTISSKKQSLTRLPKKEYEKLVESFNNYVSNKSRLNKNFTDFIQISHALFKMIFDNLPSEGSLIISPDGSYFPFEALVVNPGGPPDYILNHYATSYSYSANYLINNFAKNNSKKDDLVAFAPIKFADSLNLSGLVGSAESLTKIDRFFPGATHFISNNATRNNFLVNFPSYPIVQLYTHASSGNENLDPVIYFVDSMLYLSELLPVQKPVTQLVILSACETARGKFYQGEGIFSFNRGFASLGIPAVISTLWSVENHATYELTELFYKYLAQGLPTDVALQKAKIEFINTSSSLEKTMPYFWAGPVLTGKVDILIPKKPFLTRKIIIGSVLLIFVVSFALYIKTSRKQPYGRARF